LLCSQVATGEENELRLRLYGTRASLDWRQQEPNTLILKPAQGSQQILRCGRSFSSTAAGAMTRLPAGHPEGYLEAFAAIYRSFAEDVRRRARGESVKQDYPGIDEGLRGLSFVAAAVESASRQSAWVSLQRVPNTLM
jgi:predicted dehydrogenase